MFNYTKPAKLEPEFYTNQLLSAYETNISLF